MENRLSEYNKILKKYFGYDTLKPQQFEIIDKILNDKKDVLAILATGFGKSMTFQLPYLISKKNVIVVSPLISLMKDQQSEMEKLGIPTCVLNNTNKNKTGEKLSIISGISKIIYITPEYLEFCEDFIKELADNDALALFCIDEAHCVSTWGSDFRKSYTRLDVLKEWVPEIPILALTATASKKVRADIVKVLNIKKVHTVIGSFDRPNLYIQVKQKTKDIENDIRDLLKKYKNENMIVYCKTRDDTDKVTEIINDLGINSLSYHAGLSNKMREEVQNKFIDGEIKCIVATVAFGMGINKKNIRCVIHYGCPKNIESYYQEMGRAGRDGLPSECHMFYSAKDFIQNRYFLSEIKNEVYKAYQAEQIQNMNRYVYTNECRRILLLKSFDEDFKTTECNNCDNCKNKNKVEKIDFTIPCHQLLTLSAKFDGKCGGTFLINILRGSNAKNISEITKKNKLYGIGKKQTVPWWKAVIRILINNDYLQEVMFSKFGSSLKCTVKGLKWLRQINTTYQDLEKIKQIDRILLPITDEFKKFVKSKIIDDEHELMDIVNGDNYEDLHLSDEFKELLKNNIKVETKDTTQQQKEDKKVIDVKKSKKIIIKKKQKPTNDKKKWTDEEEKQLLIDIKNKSIKEVAEKYERTDGAIRSRLGYVAWKLYKKKIPLEKISEVTKLSNDKILKVVQIYQEDKKDEKDKKDKSITVKSKKK